MDWARPEAYTSPFSSRYASREMSYLFSPHFKISTFRRLWTSLAKGEKKLGLPIDDKQILEMEKNTASIDFSSIEGYEKKFKHDVMAHIHAFGDVCPAARGIIHLGATSSFVADNADLIQMKQGLELLFSKLISLLRILADLSEREKGAPCLAYTHFQPAQPTTIGKRFSLWLQDFLFDALEFEQKISSLPFLGAKGATGTQASFLFLFEGDESKVEELERLIAADFGFSKIIPIAGQTYPRKIDLNVLNGLESFAASAHKMGTDIRLLAHEGELKESFADTQVGSSAMPYKQNPIYAERICGLSRFVISLSQNPAYTAATQWLERSLDDSSNRRLCIPESFLGADAILNLSIDLLSRLSIDRKESLEHLEKELAHLEMEPLLMFAAKKGADRQRVHDRLKKGMGESNRKIAEELGLDWKELSPYLKIEKLIGRAPGQVEDFLEREVAPFLARHRDVLSISPQIEI